MSNISALKRQAEILLERLNGGKRFLLEDLNVRLAQARDKYPGDAVIHAVGHVVERLHAKDPNGIISQGEFENVYQELVGLNSSGTQFRQALGDLLPSQPKAQSSKNTTYIQGLRDDPSMGEIDLGVKEAADELKKLFNKSSDRYNPIQARNAREKVSAELTSLGYDSKVELLGGNSQFLIFAADLDTRAGKVRVQIPVEASGDKFPTAFISNGEVKKLNKTAINEYLESAITRRVFSSTKHYTDKLDLPRVETPEPFKAIANEVEENVLESSVRFPLASVRLAKKMILTELGIMGFKGSQVKVAEATDDGFICEAILNTPNGKTSIEIPIEFNNNMPLFPVVFAKDDFITDFNDKNLKAFVMNKEYSTAGIARVDNLLYNMSVFELKDYISRAASNGNFDQCDEAFEVISQRFDDTTYNNMVNDYQKILLSINQSKQNITQAYDDSDQFIKTPNSLYPIHKKLGRPINELVRDKNGQYHLKTSYYGRQNQQKDEWFINANKTSIGD